MIYLCRNKRNGLVKIGYTTNPTYREKTLQSEEPEVFFEQIYEGTLDQEQELHRRFADRRIRGEWFELLPRDMDVIDAMLGDPDESIRQQLAEEFGKLILRFPPDELLSLLDQIRDVLVVGAKPSMSYQSDTDKLDSLNTLRYDWIQRKNPISNESALKELRRILR